MISSLERAPASSARQAAKKYNLTHITSCFHVEPHLSAHILSKKLIPTATVVLIWTTDFHPNISQLHQAAYLRRHG